MLSIFYNFNCKYSISFLLRKNDHDIQGSLIFQDHNNSYNYYNMVYIYHDHYNILIGTYHKFFMNQNKINNFQSILRKYCLIKNNLNHIRSNLIHNHYKFCILLHNPNKHSKDLKSDQICMLNSILEYQNNFNNLCHISYTPIHHKQFLRKNYQDMIEHMNYLK